MDLTFLKNVNLFKDLTASELKTLASKLKIEKYNEDDFLIKENQENKKLFILYKGTVVISKKMSMIDDQEKIDKTFITLHEDDHAFFGEIGLLGLNTSTATCKTKTECTLLTIERKDYMFICKTYPEIGFKTLLEIARKLSGLLEKTNDDVLKLTTALIYALKS